MFVYTSYPHAILLVDARYYFDGRRYARADGGADVGAAACGSEAGGGREEESRGHQTRGQGAGQGQAGQALDSGGVRRPGVANEAGRAGARAQALPRAQRGGGSRGQRQQEGGLRRRPPTQRFADFVQMKYCNKYGC